MNSANAALAVSVGEAICAETPAPVIPVSGRPAISMGKATIGGTFADGFASDGVAFDGMGCDFSACFSGVVMLCRCEY